MNGAGVADPSPDSAAWSSVEPEHDLCGSIDHDTTIGPDCASVYMLDHCTVDVPSGVTLTIAPGTAIKAEGRGGGEQGFCGSSIYCLISVQGTLDAVGTEAEPITFTSLNDNSMMIQRTDPRKPVETQ